jgi:acetylornithine deacetylase/succinyl-diaminopimelate desuccinylase-like protein
VPGIGKGPTGASSDNGWYASKYPERATASYGISRGGNSHTYDEYITVDGLIDSTKVYALTMIDLLGIV